MVTEFGGFRWTDPRKAAAVLRDATGIDRWLAHCRQRRECVQAGANVGVFPKALAEHFDAVWTAELEAVNYADLLANEMPGNVKAFHAALGEQPGTVGCQRAELPISHYVKAGSEVPMLRIDDWGLEYCDLIALDVEGYEWPALKGAEQTIRRSWPVLVIETKGHGSRYGYTDVEMNSWIEALGYTLAERVNKDNVWV